MAVGISSLPIELRVLILRQLWNIGDLSAAIESGPSLAEAFTNSGDTTVAKVLQNEIDSRLWPLAIIIWHIRTSRRKYVIFDGGDMWKVLQDCHNTYDTSSAWEVLCCVGLSEANEHFHNLNQAVQYFTTDFLSRAGRYLSVGTCGELPIPTASEIYRVERSFYYLELFCLLWGSGKRMSADWHLEVSRGLAIELDPWMNEQIACVRVCFKVYFYWYSINETNKTNRGNLWLKHSDLLVLGGMATDGIDLGPRAIESLPKLSPTGRSKDFWVSWGLQYLYKLTKCSNDTDLRFVVHGKQSKEGSFVLRSALEELNWNYYCENPLDDPGYMDNQRTMNEDDSSPDPAKVWCSIHSADNGEQFVLGGLYRPPPGRLCCVGCHPEISD